MRIKLPTREKQVLTLRIYLSLKESETSAFQTKLAKHLNETNISEFSAKQQMDTDSK